MSVRCEECHEDWPYSDIIPNCCDCGNLVWEFPWHCFWAQIAIAALLVWATQQDRGPSINEDGEWHTWMLWFENEWVRW